MRGHQVTAVVLGLSVLIAGCTPRGEEPPPSSAPPSTSTTAEDLDGDGDYAPVEVPTQDALSDQSAIETARAAVLAWARPDLSYDAWWAGLQPFLTEGGKKSFASVDPQLVPASDVVGEPVLEESPSPWLAYVLVATDVGSVRVLLARSDSSAPWLLERIDPV